MIPCSRCRAPLTGDVFSAEGLTPCPSCGVPMRGEAFPALLRPLELPRPEDLKAFENEAGCFHHPHKKAVAICGTCGRFICQLCDIELNGGHICPACLTAGKQKHKIPALENHRILYDSAALAVALIPLIIFWLTIITAPIAIFMVFKYWNAPMSIIPRTKIRFVLAFLVAFLEIAAWTALLIGLIW